MGWHSTHHGRMLPDSQIRENIIQMVRRMMKRILYTIVMCLCLTQATAQTANDTKVMQQINAVASAMKTMQCDFVQTKYIKMLLVIKQRLVDYYAGKSLVR